MKSIYAVIIVLLVANLVATVWFGVTSQPVTSTQNKVENTLPSHMTKNVRNKIYDQFVSRYNSRDYEAMYDIFSPSAKAQIDKNETFSTFLQLVDYFDSIVEGGYSHAEHLGTQGDLKQFKLFYSVKFSENSKFGTSGSLSITLAIRNDEYEVWGFNLRST
ncbi:hypothetical protein [Paraglaciecola chathamensis]|uniref:hypothetical protein n=1 Tax=Paraglaciecola chathamensis TaxID=368405 RepID=UPI00270996DA|nr:hypothetical protein [Paraglaciecola chathamensis]MDO6561021.1 hypothetical protein [Paraglaciecola chathamensis]